MAHTLIKKKQQVQCNKCGKMTPYVIKKKKLYGEFERIYAECQNCEYQKTVYYTSKKLRKLLTKQEKETIISKKQLLTEKINSEMELLKNKFVKSSS